MDVVDAVERAASTASNTSDLDDDEPDDESEASHEALKHNPDPASRAVAEWADTYADTLRWSAQMIPDRKRSGEIRAATADAFACALGTWRKYDVKFKRGLRQSFVIDEPNRAILIRRSFRAAPMVAALVDAMNTVSLKDAAWAHRVAGKAIGLDAADTVSIAGDAWTVKCVPVIDENPGALKPFAVDETKREIQLSASSGRAPARGVEWISTAEAAQRSGQSERHVRRRCATEFLSRGLARQDSSAWFVREDADPAFSRIKFASELPGNLGELPDAHRDVVTFRAKVLREWESFRSAKLRTGTPCTEVDRLFVQLLAARHGDEAPSVRTLPNWRRQYRADGLNGLCDGRRERAAVVAADPYLDFVRLLWLDK